MLKGLTQILELTKVFAYENTEINPTSLYILAIVLYKITHTKIQEEDSNYKRARRETDGSTLNVYCCKGDNV